MIRVASVLIVVGAFACGEASSSRLETTAGVIEATRVVRPAPPGEVKPIDRAGCPPGWSAVEGKPACEPWPGPAATCAPDEARFPGTIGCARLGTTCGADGYATGLPATGVLFVNPAAPAGGDGSRAAPLATLRAAVNRAASGSIIALSEGTHFAAGPLPSNVTVWGACVARTTLSSQSSVPAIAYADTPGVVVRNLRISGQGSGARAIGSGASLSLKDVVIEGVDGVGWGAVDGARATGDSVVVRDVRPVGTVSLGIASIGGALLDATRLIVAAARGRAVQVTATATLRDAVLLDTDVLMADQTAEAVWVANGTLTLERSLVQGTHGAGVVVGTGSTVTLTDVVVRDTVITPGASTERGQAVLLLDGVLQADRLWLSNNVLAGLEAVGPMASATVRDSFIEGTQRSTQSAAGVGVSLSLGARAALERVVARSNATGGLDALSSGSEFTLIDVVVSDTRATVEGGGYALFLTAGSRATVTRARFEQSTGTAVIVIGTLQASDVVVRGTRHALTTDAPGGIGFSVARGGTAALSRWAFENNQGTGILVGDGTLTGSDLAIRDGTPTLGESAASGVACLLGTATLSKVHVERAVGIGIAGYSRGRLTLNDLIVTKTKARECGPGCEPPPPVGVLSIQKAAVRLGGFVVADNGGFGLALDDGELDAERGQVAGHVVGLNVRNEGYDFTRLDREVRYERNQTRLATEVIPLPTLPGNPVAPR